MAVTGGIVLNADGGLSKTPLIRILRVNAPRGGHIIRGGGGSGGGIGILAALISGIT